MSSGRAAASRSLGSFAYGLAVRPSVFLLFRFQLFPFIGLSSGGRSFNNDFVVVVHMQMRSSVDSGAPWESQIGLLLAQGLV